MKIFLPIALLVSLVGLTCVGCSSSSNTTTKTPQTALTDTSRNLIIYYDEAIGKDELIQAAENYGAKLLHDYQNLHGIAIQLPSGKPVDRAINHFKAINGVLSVDRDQTMQLN